MIYCHRNVSEILTLMTSTSKECIICHNWYALDKGFRFQSSVCNGCHNALMMSAILISHGIDYRWN